LRCNISAPLFATVLASELSPTLKRNYFAAFIPELFAATLGFVIYFGVTGSSLLGSYHLPEYQLTATGGSSQMGTEIQISETMGAGLIAAILIGKMIAIALSQSSGFLGGVVFPSIFLGGTAGLLVHSIFPGIPIALCVGAMLAAVPGAFLDAPLSLIIIATGTIRLAPEALVPIGIAVVIAHVLMSVMRKYVLKEALAPSN
jgi:H+/Cl- antiporter ClcA